MYRHRSTAQGLQCETMPRSAQTTQDSARPTGRHVTTEAQVEVSRKADGRSHSESDHEDLKQVCGQIMICSKRRAPHRRVYSEGRSHSKSDHEDLKQVCGQIMICSKRRAPPCRVYSEQMRRLKERGVRRQSNAKRKLLQEYLRRDVKLVTSYDYSRTITPLNQSQLQKRKRWNRITGWRIKLDKPSTTAGRMSSHLENLAVLDNGNASKWSSDRRKQESKLTYRKLTGCHRRRDRTEKA
jgi:hypothetical protein